MLDGELLSAPRPLELEQEEWEKALLCFAFWQETFELAVAQHACPGCGGEGAGT